MGGPAEAGRDILKHRSLQAFAPSTGWSSVAMTHPSCVAPGFNAYPTPAVTGMSGPGVDRQKLEIRRPLLWRRQGRRLGPSKVSNLRFCQGLLQKLALARLWALGSVRDCGRSCADCGLGALARQILFFLVARNCPSNPSNPSNASTLANGSAILLDSGRFRRSMDASDAPKPRTC